MDIYMVGGAIRDFLLAVQNNQISTNAEKKQYWAHIEKDWVVIGSTPKEMLAKGFNQVGKSFPVFLHPKTQEEYALARTERKVAKGYVGFECYSSPDVTLEEDLKRRDLTINAMAMPVDAQGEILTEQLIDPYGGLQDLQNKIFRHVSTAFIEDPVRILRVARFAARFGDFKVAVETNVLMKDMVASGEISALVPERVWQELARALNEQHLWRFFAVLNDCGAINVLFPELQYTPELTPTFKTLFSDDFMTLKALPKDQIQFAILTSNLSANTIQNLCQRYRIPNEFRDLAVLVTQQHTKFEACLTMSAEELLSFIESCDALRRQQRFFNFLITCQVIETTRKDSNQALSEVTFLKHVLDTLLKVNTQEIVAQGLQGIEFAEALRKMRIMAIRNIKELNGLMLP
jgi:tRNA nucleotidyltransferase (CCA-adding enzyme)